MLLPGQYYDAETNTHYNYFRDYDPAQGRYVESDPIGLDGGGNIYDYVSSNPLVRRDPLGLWSTAAHEYFFDGLGFGPIETNWMKGGSYYIDTGKKEFQDAAHSFMHAMSSNLLDKAQAKQEYCKFIQDQYDFYLANRRSNNQFVRRAAYWSLGQAMHAVQDSTSPVHRDFQRWGADSWPQTVADAMQHGPFPSSRESMFSAPAYFDETLNKMNFLLKYGTAPECDCN